MSQLKNQYIPHKSTKSNYNHVYDKLQDYMLLSKNMAKFTRSIIKKSNKKPQPPATKSVNTIFFPSQKDQLFWCFYIFLNDKATYELNSNKSFIIEKEFKISTIEKIRCNTSLLKSNKLRRNEIENELLNLESITMKGLHALCLYYDINLFYINGNKYYEMVFDSNKPIHVIECVDKKYGLRENVSNEKIAFYRENYWRLESLTKPLRAISSYKHIELAKICRKLHIDTIYNGKKKDKKELYQNILSKL